MNRSRPIRLARRILLGAPALVAAAVAVTHGRGASTWRRLAEGAPAHSRQTTTSAAEPECAADIQVTEPEGAS